MKDARKALNDALQAAAEEHPSLMEEQRIKRVFQVVIIALSGEDAAIRNWNDVRGCAKEAVEAHLDPDMKAKLQDSVTSILMDIIDRAQKDAPTFVSPPPFQ